MKSEVKLSFIFNFQTKKTGSVEPVFCCVII